MYPDNIRNVEQIISSKSQNNGADNNKSVSDQNPNMIPNIIVSTVPAELIQSNGEPSFTPIEGTTLLYISNSDNDIFMDENSQQYFVLISGRWYQTKNLNSDNWKYIPADQLPADFAKIPPGSAKGQCTGQCGGNRRSKGCCDGCRNSANSQSGS